MEPTFENAKMLFDLVNTNRAHIRAWLNSDPNEFIKTPEYAFKFLESTERSWNTKRSLRFGIFLDNKLIGLRTANDISIHDRSFWVSSFLAKSYTGNGYATESLHVLLQQMFGYGFNRATFRCDADNERAAKLALRAGFTKEGMLRQLVWDDARGEFVDKIMFSMLKSEYKPLSD